ATTPIPCRHCTAPLHDALPTLSDAKTCTITNTAVGPTLKVTKVVDNGASGATAVAGDFSLFVDGNGVTSGATNAYTVGNHTVAEGAHPGYTEVISGDCNATTGVVTLALSDAKTCTITLSPAGPTLKVTKVVDNGASGATAVAGDFSLFVDGN